MEFKDKQLKEIYKELSSLYPQAKCGLDFGTPFQLLIATILSSQCTDDKVNKITSKLFRVAPTPREMLKLGKDRLKEYIRSAGLYENKSKNIIYTSKIILEKYQGEVPATRKELENLPGVGRKTANVVLSNAFGVAALAVDTHVYRVSKRLGLARGKSALEVERELMEKIPREFWGVFHHLLIYHGRITCKAKNPACSSCIIKSYCKYPVNN